MANNQAFSKSTQLAPQASGEKRAPNGQIGGGWIVEVRPAGASRATKRFLVRSAARRENAIAAVLRVVGIDANLLSVNRTDGEEFKNLPGNLIELA